MPNLQEWLENHRFSSNPFALTSLCAEEDIGLFDEEGTYLIEPPFYSEIRGTEQDHGPRFVFASKGGGKTTIAKLIERDISNELCAKKGQAKSFAVVYDDFDLVISRSKYLKSEITPRHHVEQVIILTLEKLLEILGMEDQKERVKTLRREDKRLLFQYVKDFGSFHPLQRDRLLKTVKGLKRSVSRDDNLKLLADFLTALEDTLSLPGLSLKGVFRFASQVLIRRSERDKRIVDLISARKLLEDTGKICRIFGFSQIYVLIDNVDDAFFLDAETSFEASLALVKSLGSYTRILQIPGLIFKIFLSSDLYPEARKLIRLDRLGARVLSWNREAMERIYQQRLAACWDSQKEIREKYSISELCAKDLVMIVDSEIVEFGVKYNSPRAMLLLGSEMLAEHFCFGLQDLRKKITQESWKRARQRSEELLCNDSVSVRRAKPRGRPASRGGVVQ